MRLATMSPAGRSVDRRVAQFLFALWIALLVSGGWAQAWAQTDPQHSSELDARNAQGLPPLIVAASTGRLETIKSLLAQGAGMDATAADGRTALIAAAQNGQIDAVRVLIAAGANLNWAARNTGTALNVAENKGETQIAALLLASGAHSTGKSVGDTVCVRPWGGNGFCGVVRSFSVRAVQIKVTKLVGCANGCAEREECSAGVPVGGAHGIGAGDSITVPSWCVTQTGVNP